MAGADRKKASMRMLVITMAGELKEDNIRVRTVTVCGAVNKA